MYFAAFSFDLNRPPPLDFPGGSVRPDQFGGHRCFGLRPLITSTAKSGLTPDQIETWLMANYLMRPPLPDAEIRAMPVMEVINLYYSINQVVGCNKYKYFNDAQAYNPILSAGLPGDYDVGLGFATRDRIYNLRPDLRTIQHPNTGQVYPVLLPPSDLAAPSCGPEELREGITGILTFVSAVAGLIGGLVGTILTTAESIASSTYSAIDKASLARLAAKGRGQAGDVANGILIADAVLKPVASIDDILTLKRGYADWQAMIARIEPHIDEIISWHRQMPLDYSAITCAYSSGSYLQPYKNQYGVTKNRVVWNEPASSRWKPYRDYFWSKSVRDAVMNYHPPLVTSTHNTLPGQTNNVSINQPEEGQGVGLGLLFLLLL